MLGPEDEGAASNRPLLCSSGHGITLNFMKTARLAGSFVSQRETFQCIQRHNVLPPLHTARLFDVTYVM